MVLLEYSWDDGSGENKFINIQNGLDPMYAVRVRIFVVVLIIKYL